MDKYIKIYKNIYGPIYENMYGETYKTHYMKTLSLRASFTNLKILRKIVQDVHVKTIYVANLTGTCYILVEEIFSLIVPISILILTVNINITSKKGGGISNLIH